ncbi:hypothetical protein Cni_G00645 [Canna indica]|uniref:F-box/LRR-repeat protein 15-like leucin rich repeat domain-containing protein n=1 Tax=Canna indica TaxID=4628 RepID=A0AAQ3JL89_9LILI|nr:hypothetical protein Cni_G00645 [Canna indica]
MTLSKPPAASSNPAPETLDAPLPPPVPTPPGPTAAAGESSPFLSHATASSVLGSGSVIDPYGAMPPRRRSVRLASSSISSPGSDTYAAAGSCCKRNPRSRVSKSKVEAQGLYIETKADRGKRKVEAMEVAAGSYSADTKIRGPGVTLEGKYMCLRSGSRIARRGSDQVPVRTNNAQTENLGSVGQCIKEAFEEAADVDMVPESLEETIGEELAFHREPQNQHAEVIIYEKIREAVRNKKGKDKLAVEEIPLHGSEIDMDVDATVKHVVGQKEDDLVSKRKPQKARAEIESRKEADRSRAKELAPKFAFFKPKEDINCEEEEIEDYSEGLSQDDEHGDWPGPFSTAMKIIEERNEKLKARESSSSVKKTEITRSRISWMPSKNCKPLHRVPPTLGDLCLKVLLDNVEEIESLDGIPDNIKNRFILKLCHTRRMSSRLLGLLASGNPTEICLNDCSWATEDLFEDVFSKCNMKCLKVVQLDMCGRCLPDYVLRSTLAQYPNSLPSLTTICLKGSYRLSDDGLNAIVSSAPSLTSVNLSQCSLLTSLGIINLAHKLDKVLRELYIDDCQNVDVMAILPALKKLVDLEVLSVAGIHSVCDKFVQRLIPVCGPGMKELIFAGCQKLTTYSIKTIGAYCSSLCAIDLQNLKRLNDTALGYLANGCTSLQKLKLRQNAFSDEAVAALLEASGGSLTELSLNNVTKVAEQTALAISHQCSSTLYSLDVSFCREMTDEALGLIVDSCSSLRILKLFGCTQVTEVFFNGHSNSRVKLIGCKGQKLIDEIGIRSFDY